MVRTLANVFCRDGSVRPRVGLWVMTGVAVSVALTLIHADARGQVASPDEVHYRHSVVDAPPGAIGQQQLTRGGPLRGYFQPVQILGPEGTRVAFAVGGQFDRPQEMPRAAGMLIGQVYRLRVTGIRLYEGIEVFPTVEVIDRLYPPEGNRWRFPIPIELTHDELEHAMEGKLVTRVIYLEDPERALPLPEVPGDQRYFEVGRDQDPLQVADQLGRPVAILRMGSRTPPRTGPDVSFLFGCPPLVQAPRLPHSSVEEAPGNGALEEVIPREMGPSFPGREAR
jgi:hypothetical protein